MFCVNARPRPHSDMHVGSFFLEPGDIKSMGLGAICGFGKATGLP
jgi:hypothetical protein